jgi:hypothetical protein
MAALPIRPVAASSANFQLRRHLQIFNNAIFAIFHTNPRVGSKVWQSLNGKWSARHKHRC